MDAIDSNMANKLDKTANAVSATKWQTARKLILSGDGSGETSLDGSADKTMTVTHKTSGATAGSYVYNSEATTEWCSYSRSAGEQMGWHCQPKSFETPL